MTAVVKSVSGAALAPIEPALGEALRYQVSRLTPPYEIWRTKYDVSSADVPSEAVRDALATRLAEIERAMQPAGMAEANKQYGLNCTALGVANVDDETAELEIAAFLEATSDLPLFALKAACRGFRLGQFGEGQWAPKGGQVRREALKLTAGFVRERREIEAVLNAEPKTYITGSDERRRSILDGLAKAVAARSLDGEGRPHA